MTMGMWNDENGEKCLTKNKQSPYVSSAAAPSNRLLAGSGNGSAAMPAGISGGTATWNW